MSISNCCIEGGFAEGSMTEDPLFNEDYTLSEESPYYNGYGGGTIGVY